MERIFRFFGKEYIHLNQAALLLGFFTLFSQVLGLFRDRLIAHYIGPSITLDAYYAAFRVPDFVFISIASLASITVLIPFLLNRMKGEELSDEAEKFLQNIFSAFLYMLICISIIIFFLMPFIVKILVPGFEPEIQEKVVELSRIMLLSPILLGLSNLLGALTQMFKRFFIYSLSPIFYNLGIIIGVVFLYPLFDIYGLAMGVVLGAVMHFAIQFFSVKFAHFTFKIKFKINWQEVKSVILVSMPRTLGLSFNNIALIILISFASFLKEGSISIFTFSINLQSVPLGVIGISYAAAAFPTLSRSFKDGNLTEFKDNLIGASRQIIFWSLPVAFLFIVIRAQIVRVILGSVGFSWENTRLVAASLAMFSISIVAQCLIALFARAYYAGGNTKTPLYINFFSSISIIIFAFIFLKIFKNFEEFQYFIESLFKVSDIAGTEVLMLPLAYSIGTIMNFILLWVYIKKDFIHRAPFIFKSFFQSLSASFFLGFSSYLALNAFSSIFNLNTFWGIFLQGFLAGIIGIISFSVILYFFKNEEFLDLLKTVKTKFWRNSALPPSEENA